MLVPLARRLVTIFSKPRRSYTTRPTRSRDTGSVPSPSSRHLRQALTLSHPLQALIDLHRTLLVQYTRLSSLSTSETAPPLEQLGRCETLLNITCAEMARIADERTQVLAEAVESWLEAQVRKHEQVRRVVRPLSCRRRAQALNDATRSRER